MATNIHRSNYEQLRNSIGLLYGKTEFYRKDDESIESIPESEIAVVNDDVLIHMRNDLNDSINTINKKLLI